MVFKLGMRYPRRSSHRFSSCWRKERRGPYMGEEGVPGLWKIHNPLKLGVEAVFWKLHQVVVALEVTAAVAAHGTVNRECQMLGQTLSKITYPKIISSLSLFAS